MADILIPIGTFIVGLIGGAWLGFVFFKRQMMNLMHNPDQLKDMMRQNPDMLEKMGRTMGANPAQLRAAKKMMNRKR